MAEFPTTPAPQLPVEITAGWKTITSAADSAKEQRRQKQVYAKYDVTLTYSILEAAEIALLWNFYNACRGSLTAFYFYMLESDAWTGLFIGTGDAAEHTFDIPGKSTSSHAIYVNGVLDDAHSILTGGGMENSDRVYFTNPPAINDIITCDFTGYMRNRCRFAEDQMTKKRFVQLLYSTGLKLKGLAAL